MELSRISSRAVIDGMLAGLVIGLPPVLNFGSKQLIEEVVPDVRLLFFLLNCCLLIRDLGPL